MPVVKQLKTGSTTTVRQPKPPFRSLPANSIHIGPSGSSKTYTLIATLTQSDMLGAMFDKYLLLSPNIFIDPQYRVLIDHVKQVTGQKEDEFCFEEFDQPALRKLMEDQKKINTYLRKIKAKRDLKSHCRRRASPPPPKTCGHLS